MHGRLILFLSVFLGALGITGCQFPSLAPVPNAPGVTPSPALLFQDNFSDPSSGWTRLNLPEGSADYADGVYRIQVNAANMDIWGRPGLDFTNVSIQVDTLRVGGARDNRFGVICRMLDQSHFYVFLISSDGYYGIGKVDGDQYNLIAAEAMLPNEKIRQGSDPNHVRADCTGEVLALYVNGELIAVTSDADFQHGDIGLIAGAYGAIGTEIFFDNLLVRQP